MAPRGKPRKGQMRKDAAMDAMRKYGFEDGAINDAIKELLKLYGDDGWMFIEDYAYKELLDKILENNNGQEEDTTTPLLEFNDGAEPYDTTQEAGPSSPARPCSNVDFLPYVGSPSTDEPLDSVFTITEVGAAALPPIFSSGGPSCSNIELLQMIGSPSIDEPLNCAFTNDLDVGSIRVVENAGEEVDMDIDLGEDTHVIEAVQAMCKKDDSTVHSSVSKQLTTLVQVNQSRKRFHGWISKDDVDPSDIVTLERAPLPEKLQRLLDEAKANNCMPSWAIMRH